MSVNLPVLNTTISPASQATPRRAIAFLLTLLYNQCTRYPEWRSTTFTLVLKTAAWLCFAFGIVVVYFSAEYQPPDHLLVNIPIDLAIFWGLWFFLMRAAVRRERRERPSTITMPELRDIGVSVEDNKNNATWQRSEQYSAMAQAPKKSKSYAWVFLLVLFLAAFGIVALGQSQSARQGVDSVSQSRPSSPRPLEYQLALINNKGYISPDDTTVGQFRHLLDNISAKSGESKQHISDVVVYIQQKLHDENGEDVGLLDIMNSLNDLVSAAALSGSSTNVDVIGTNLLEALRAIPSK